MHSEIPTKYYFINKLDTNIINKQDKSTAFIYRNYSKQINVDTIIKIKKICKINNSKLFLSNDIKLAIKLKLNGAYIPSFNHNKKHLSYTVSKGFILIGSAHNLKEIRIKEDQGVSAIFLSSIFKHNKNYLGLNKFKLLTNLTQKKIIALGGISNKNLKLLNLIDCVGFAGISFFQKKTAPKKGPFK